MIYMTKVMRVLTEEQSTKKGKYMSAKIVKTRGNQSLIQGNIEEKVSSISEDMTTNIAKNTDNENKEVINIVIINTHMEEINVVSIDESLNGEQKNFHQRVKKTNYFHRRKLDQK